MPDRGDTPSAATASSVTAAGDRVLEDSWCHVKETITMLYLSVCQIKTSVTESGHSMAQLTHAFTRLAQHSRQINDELQSITRQEQLNHFKDAIGQTTGEMQARTNEAITAFQFYDRISQRLDHVALCLEKTTEVMASPVQLNDPEAWERIKSEVQSSYSMEAERIMFQHIMRGATVKEALEIYRHHFSIEEGQEPVGPAGEGEGEGDEIELF